LYAKYKSQGLEIISVDVADSAGVIRKWAKSGGFTFNMVMNPSDVKNNIAQRYGLVATPTNIVLSPTGKVINRYIGFDPKGLVQDFHKLGIKN
jgi:alkyl hydroperoxide reductase subunit AhpC